MDVLDAGMVATMVDTEGNPMSQQAWDDLKTQGRPSDVPAGYMQRRSLDDQIVTLENELRGNPSMANQINSQLRLLAARNNKAPK